MKAATSSLLFICGSVDPGRNGVGDYARRLACHLIDQGMRARIIATHEPDIQAVTEEVQTDSGTDIVVVRVPASLSEPERLALLQQEIESFPPDWISLQFVAFSYAKNGLPWQFARSLKEIAGLARFEVMFHELWLGHHPAGRRSVRELIYGTLQRWIILRICATLKPEVVHTHIPVNQGTLEKFGVVSRPLPLFANIGRISGGGAQEHSKSPGVYRVAFFSRMETPDPIRRALIELADWCAANELELEVALLGGSQGKVTAAASEIRDIAPSSTVLPVGYLTAEEVSAWLATCDLAITPISRHSVGKSGTVAAFLEHQLPVIAPVVVMSLPPFFRAELNELVLDRFDAEGVARARKNLRDGAVVGEKLDSVGRKFIEDLHLIHPDNKA